MMNAKVMNAYSKKQQQMTNKHLNSESYKHEVEQFAKRNHDKWATTADETLQRHPKTGHWEKKPQWDHSEINKKINSKEEYFSQVSKIKKPEDLEAILAEEDELWNS